MGSLFRSEVMSLCQLVLQPEGAYPVVAELGELGLVQFRDLNAGSTAFKRKYVNEVKRCDEMERKIVFLEREITKDGIEVDELVDEPRAPLPWEMIDLEATLDKLEVELKEVNSNAEALKRNYMELTELKHILSKTQHFFNEQEQGVVDEHMAIVGLDVLSNQQSPVQLGFIAGVIRRDKVNAFERMLWRVCLNNVFLRYEEIEQPLVEPGTGHEVKKCVFILFFQGDQLKIRIRKICEGFHATLYPCPDNAADRNDMASGVATRISDLNTVIAKTDDHRARLLKSTASLLKSWFIKIRKLKAVFHILNQFNFDTIQKCMVSELWCPASDLDKVKATLAQAALKSSSIAPILAVLETDEIRPTFVRSNKFTKGFQNLVDSYGVADYREINPGPFAVISFPFLFAVMFGDAGHGLIMALFGLWMVLYERGLSTKKTSNEMWNILFAGRYVILLMGLFSIYTGFIYNDVFSKAMNIFGSSWGSNYTDDTLIGNKLLQMDPRKSISPLTLTGGNYYTTPYPFGIDPVWQLSQNKLTFLNSYKMKLSVILGVTQMIFGVFLSCFNHIYFRKYMNVFFEFIPQVIFLAVLFGYLCVLIVWKWFKYDAETSKSAPNLLITLIDMFMQKDYINMYDSELQGALQKVFVVVAVVCIPWMLLIKPFFLLCKNNRKVRQMQNRETAVEEGVVNHANGRGGEANKSGGHGAGHNENEFEFGEVFIHQAIHTIDYCLGCISNTASYLRLWALSLAHSQLSEVLWSMVMRNALTVVSGNVGGVAVFVFFAPWAFLTVAILLIMEGLSAFLHALRLHWVEFQNKFYTGSGYLFVPFSFKVILEEMEGIEP